MSKKTLLILFITVVVSLVTLLSSTSPANSSSIVLLIPFVLIYTMIWSGLSLILRLNGMQPRKAMQLSLLFAALPSGLLVLQSIGQLSPWDIITTIAFVIVAFFYVSKLMMPKVN